MVNVTVHNDEWNAILNFIEQSLDNTSHKNTIMVGDMNINLAAGASNCPMRNDYKNLIASLGLDLCNNEITREASNSILDHFLSNMSG